MNKNIERWNAAGNRSLRREENSKFLDWIALIVWVLAAAVAFLPFAYGTSPLDAVMLHVPGNQGNWWHLLAAAPYFLAFPMIWLRLRGLVAAQPSTQIGRRLIWIAVAVSTLGTIMVEAPFLLHLAGTSEWQRFVILSLGFGVVIVCGIALLLRRRFVSSTRACLIALMTAYLANDALCLVVYSGAEGTFRSRSGWFVSIAIVGPILFDLLRNLMRAFRTEELRATETLPA